MKIFKLINNKDIAFTYEKSKRKFLLYKDGYEGGEAYITDWEYIDFFKTLKSLKEYIKSNYGDYEEIIK